jgi:hypothetical protein
VGWIAQLNEMIGDPEYKIGRPRQLFTGAVRRDVLPIANDRPKPAIMNKPAALRAFFVSFGW